MNLFAVEPADLGQPFWEARPEGRRCVGIVEYIFGDQRQVDATKKQEISQAFYAAGGVDGYEEDRRSPPVRPPCHAPG